MLIAARPGAGMKGKQVAKRGQQKPGQPLAQARERLWPQARSGPGQEYIVGGEEREGPTVREEAQDTEMGMGIHAERDRDSEMVRHTQGQRQGERQKKG